MPPTTPDVRSSDESESNISPNVPEYDGESEGQRRTREKGIDLKKVIDAVPNNEKKHKTHTRWS
jgi:hypothetical protein